MIRKAFALLRRYSRRERYRYIEDLMSVESRRGLMLDLGGGPASFFATMFPKPERVILLDVDFNLAFQAKQKRPGLHAIVADGEHLPLADCTVDMTICNSVIEHVDNPAALAREIRRVSRGYFLQTPNGNFPLETHSFIAIPFFHLIPWMWLRQFVCRLLGANFEYVSNVRYLPEQTLAFFFPEALITYEKVLGLKKSFYVRYLDEKMK